MDRKVEECLYVPARIADAIVREAAERVKEAGVPSGFSTQRAIHTFATILTQVYLAERREDWLDMKERQERDR